MDSKGQFEAIGDVSVELLIPRQVVDYIIFTHAHILMNRNRYST